MNNKHTNSNFIISHQNQNFKDNKISISHAKILWRKTHLKSTTISSATVTKGDRGKTLKAKFVSKSSKAGLQFSIGRISRFFTKGRYEERVGSDFPVYLLTVLEYLAAKVLKSTGNAAMDNKKNMIISRHIQLVVMNDGELEKLMGGATIANGRVLPNIYKVLSSNKTGKVKGKTGSAS